MTGRVRREGNWARKRLGARLHGLGPEQVRRSVLLRAAGVPMPVFKYDEAADEIFYPWLSGTTGAERLRARLAGPPGRVWEDEIGSACADLLRPLVRLHAADPRDLALAQLDPWCRVRPRIDDLAPSASGAQTGRDAIATYDLLVESLGEALGQPGAAGWGPVHGDFHVGQIVFEEAAGEAWLLDADDFALGPPESDLGNFTAHLATSDYVGSAPPLAAFAALAGRVIQHYAELAGRGPEPRRVEAYGAVALLRRALKLRERVPADDRIGVILAAARSVARQLQ